ncbi:LUD domain-containing protein [Candidatus Halobonum tyrrellensis]|uniref:LUD domain-containing protein n=1 Tax=Candidatus Halobonum tyrrellensis G22 TaxID=1324957 RepID=V4H8G5_9EURY|nr:LUD domain-containing protein [Candidatus Halobonum tyrrellensis]ESP86995.1 hypothetical protein K933_15787 [Candidatus Halobonum tyrrellensis G22]
MSATPVETLVSSLGSLDVPVERTPPEGFDEALAPHLGSPAVGVSLDGAGVSLAGTDVTVDPTPAELKAAHTGVTTGAFAVADYGSVVIPSAADGTELVSLYVDRHVAVVDARDVLPGMEAAFDRFGETIRADGLSAIVATGPSATADMGALVRGAHGPSDVRVVLVERGDGGAERAGDGSDETTGDESGTERGGDDR